MKLYNLNSFINGWIVGNFNPSILNTQDFEVAVKKYRSGDYEKNHHHRVSTEITVIIMGKVKMNGVIYKKNDIILINPNESTDFECLTNVTTLVIKTPSIPDDKYIN